VPVRLGGLELLINERRKARLREIYLGNIQWSLLQHLHSMTSKDHFSAPTYGAFAEKLDAQGHHHDVQAVKKQVAGSIAQMLLKHLGEEDNP
jgi:hypothetical protein